MHGKQDIEKMICMDITDTMLIVTYVCYVGTPAG